MIEMKSKSDFHNTRAVKADGTHTLKPGDTFTTDFLHAKDLVAGGLAEPVDPDALAQEPNELLKPHSSLSTPALKAHNERRGARAVAAENARLRDVDGELQTLRGEHETLRGEHERLVGAHERLVGDRDAIAAELASLKAEHERLVEHAGTVTAERDKAVAAAKKAGSSS